MLINGLAARSRIAGSDFDAPLLAVKMGIISQYFSAKPPEHAMLPEGPCVLCTIPAIFGLSGRNAFIKGFPASQERGNLPASQERGNLSAASPCFWGEFRFIICRRVRTFCNRKDSLALPSWALCMWSPFPANKSYTQPSVFSSSGHT